MASLGLGLGLTRNVVGGFRASASFNEADDFSTGVVGTITTSGAEGAVSLVGGAVTDQAGTNSGLFSITTGLEVTFNPQALGSGLATDGDSTSTTYAIQLTDTVTTIDVTVRVTLTKPDQAPVAAGGLADLTLGVDNAMTAVNVATDFTDADDTLTFTASNLPAGLSLSSAGSLTGTPTSLVSGQIVTVTATDAGGQTATSAFQIDVIVQQPLKTVSVMNFLGNGKGASNSATHQDVVMSIPFVIGGTTVDSLVLSMSNWGISGNGTNGIEIPSEGYRVEEAYLTRNTGGTSVQVTKDSATTWVIAAGESDTHSDEINASAFSLSNFPVGDELSLKVRYVPVNSSNVIVDGGEVAKTDAPRFANPSSLRVVRGDWTSAELQTYGTLVTPSGASIQSGGRTLPMILLGRHSSAYDATFGAIGDSRTQGVGDDRIEFETSYATRAMVDDVNSPTTWLPSINMAISGGVASAWAVAAPNSAHDVLTSFFQYFDVMIENYGVNSRSATHTTQRKVIWDAFKADYPSKTIIAVDVMGQTTSTDAWATLANQTIGSESDVGEALDTMNAAVAADPNVDHFVETLSIRGSTDDTSSDYWKWGTSLTGDGLHENAAGHEAKAQDLRDAIAVHILGAPTLTSATDAANGASAATGSVSTNEGNGTLYWVVTTSATRPTGAQVEAGEDSSGSSATADGSQSVSATGAQNITPSGLSSATAYTTHFMHKDAAGNRSSVVSASGFTTAAAPATFGSGDWAVTTGSGVGEIDIAITTLPSDNGSAITALQYSTDAGTSYANLTGTGTGSRTVDTLSAGGAISDGQSFSSQIMVRAVNAEGNGANSDAKTVSAGSSATGPVVSAHTGTLTTSGGDNIYTFTSSGSITFSTGGTVRVLAVGGGGGGDTGGGGAGEFEDDAAVNALAQTYTITVGSGGAGGSSSANGGDTTALGITAIGGGAGGGLNEAGSDGGSGGGEGVATNSGRTGGAATGSFSGNKGGDVDRNSSPFPAAGGGGAGGAGGDVGSGDTLGTDGGDGLSSDITGSTVFYAGGGGGGQWNASFTSSGGNGGGGDPGNPASNGTDGLGGGGGGSSSSRNGGDGGDGVVIIRFTP